MFQHVTKEDIEGISSNICNSVTLSTPDAAAAFAAAPGLRVQAAQGCTVTVRVRDGMSALTTAMARFPVTSIDAPRQSLEDVFLHYYGKEAQS